jgi:hypothetical protein
MSTPALTSLLPVDGQINESSECSLKVVSHEHPESPRQLRWLGVLIFGVAVMSAAFLVVTGLAAVREDQAGSDIDGTLAQDYISFETLYAPLLYEDALNNEYNHLAQFPDGGRSVHPVDLAWRSRSMIGASVQARFTAESLGASVRLAPARDLYVQAFTDVTTAWEAEESAESEWRAGNFPPDVTGIAQGRAAHSLSWYRGHSHSSLGDAATLAWSAHQLLAVIAAQHRLPMPHSSLPAPPKPLFRGVQSP